MIILAVLLLPVIIGFINVIGGLSSSRALQRMENQTFTQEYGPSDFGSWLAENPDKQLNSIYITQPKGNKNNG